MFLSGIVMQSSSSAGIISAPPFDFVVIVIGSLASDDIFTISPRDLDRTKSANSFGLHTMTQGCLTFNPSIGCLSNITIRVLPAFIVQHDAPSGSKSMRTGTGGLSKASLLRNAASEVPFALRRTDRLTLEFGVRLMPPHNSPTYLKRLHGVDTNPVISKSKSSVSTIL